VSRTSTGTGPHKHRHIATIRIVFASQTG
jgi:hypothetical protein